MRGAMHVWHCVLCTRRGVAAPYTVAPGRNRHCASAARSLARAEKNVFYERETMQTAVAIQSHADWRIQRSTFQAFGGLLRDFLHHSCHPISTRDSCHRIVE
jgi:hypothetical protein